MSLSTAPTVILDKSQTLALIGAGVWPDHCDKWSVKSTWICERLNAFESDGYVYNAQAQRRIEAEEDLPAHEENGSILSILIYNAQRYRQEDRLTAEGYEPLTPDLVQRAMATNRKVEVQGENIIGGACVTLCRPIQTADGYAVLLPKKRNKGFRANGQYMARLAQESGSPVPKHATRKEPRS